MKNLAFLIKNSEFITEQSLVYKEEIKIMDLLFLKITTIYNEIIKLQREIN